MICDAPTVKAIFRRMMHFAAAAADNEQMAAVQDDLIESCGGVEVGR